MIKRAKLDIRYSVSTCKGRILDNLALQWEDDNCLIHIILLVIMWLFSVVTISINYNYYYHKHCLKNKHVLLY